MTLVQRPIESYAYDDAAEVSSTVDITPAWPESPLILAGWALDQERVGGIYNGKIDSPAILSRALSPGELDGIFLRPMPPAIQGARRGLRLLARDFFDAGDRHRPLRSARRGGEPARPRHEGLELDRRGAVLAAQARAVRRDPFPRRRPLRRGLGQRLLLHRARGHEERRLCRAPRDRGGGRRGRRRHRRGLHPLLRPAAARRRRAQGPAEARLPRADRGLHGLRQPSGAPARRAGRDGDRPPARVPADRPVLARACGVRRLALRPAQRRQRRLLLLAPAADPQPAPEIQLLGRRRGLGPLAVQCRHAPDRLARARGFRRST